MGKELWGIVKTTKYFKANGDIDVRVRVEKFCDTKEEAENKIKKWREEDTMLKTILRERFFLSIKKENIYETHKVLLDKGVLFCITDYDGKVDLRVVDTIGKNYQYDTIRPQNMGKFFMYCAYIYGFNSEQVCLKFEDLLLKYKGKLKVVGD